MPESTTVRPPGESATASADRVFYPTVTLCPTCQKLIPGQVVGRTDGVFVTRRCPEHGPFDGLICSDREWYDRLPLFDVEPIKPEHPGRKPEKGCPSDCGLCSAHRQIAGTAAIEISNRCNANCPVCLARNDRTFELSVEDVKRAVERLLRAQDTVDVVAVSGGEPTIHPRLFEILRALDRPEIGRIALNSNGLRIAREDLFLEELARHEKVYVSLHFDGSRSKELRGIAPEVQEKALERLGEWGINVAPVILAAKGVNEGELGTIVPSLVTKPAVKTAIVSLMTYAGKNGSRFPGDPTTRLTIPAALDAIEAGSGGSMRKRDFIPLPMPNPLCAAVGYFLVDGSEVTPLLPLVDLDAAIEGAGNANFVRVDRELEKLLRDAVDRVYSNPTAYDRPERLLARFRELLLRLFPEDRTTGDDERRAIVEEHVKVVYVMQFMDAWTFDSKRLEKCSCQHLLPDGKIIPSCGYYAYHRRFDPRFDPSYVVQA